MMMTVVRFANRLKILLERSESLLRAGQIVRLKRGL